MLWDTFYYAPFWHGFTILRQNSTTQKVLHIAALCFRRGGAMKKIILIAILILLAGINALFDFLRHASITKTSSFVVFSIAAAGIATGAPVALAFFISSRAKFKNA